MSTLDRTPAAGEPASPASEPRVSTRRRSAVIAGAIVLAALGALAFLLTRRGDRYAATNTRVPASLSGVPVPPKSQRCQGGEYVPSNANRLRLGVRNIVSVPTPVMVTLRTEHGAPLATSSQVVARPGPLVFTLPSQRPSASQASLCVRNAGLRPVSFDGNLSSVVLEAPRSANGRGERQADEIRADYLLPGRPSYWDIAPLLATRFPLFKPGWVGPWAFWVLGALAGLTAIGAGLVLRRAIVDAA